MPYPEFKADTFFSHEQCISPNNLFPCENWREKIHSDEIFGISKAKRKEKD